MDFTITNKDRYNLVKVSGRLIEKSQAEGLIKEFEGFVEAGNTQYLMDLQELEYVNSTGLNLLIGMFTQARNAGGELVIGGISPKVKKLMVMTKLDSIFKIYDSVEEATDNL